MEDTVTVDLMDDGMYHDTLYVRGITGFTYQTPPQLGNSTLLYFGTDSNGFQNPFALFRVSSNSITTPVETFASLNDSTIEIDSAKFILTFNEDSITTGMIFDLFYFQEGGDSIFSESESNYLNITENDLNSTYIGSSRLSQKEPDSLGTTSFPTLSFNVSEILDSFSDTSSENRNLTVMIKPKFELSDVFSFKSSESGFTYAPQIQVFTHDTAFVDSTGDSVVVDTISHTFISTDDLSIIIPPNGIDENPNNISLGRGMTYKAIIQIPDLDSISIPQQAIITQAELSLFYVNDTSQSNFYLQIHPITDTVSIAELQGLLPDDPLVTEPSLIAVNLSNNGRISLNIREYLQLHHFGYIQNQGLKMEVANTVSPFNTYSFYISNLDSLAPKLIIHYVAP
ncbi:MAG: hypothetical protein NZ763_09750 [Candidatus Marinimicrobia bacterium]|nr:hypothetical protein [Candidatus Neomarinimicrobiota bacterium]